MLYMRTISQEVRGLKVGAITTSDKNSLPITTRANPGILITTTSAIMACPITTSANHGMLPITTSASQGMPRPATGTRAHLNEPARGR